MPVSRDTTAPGETSVSGSAAGSGSAADSKDTPAFGESAVSAENIRDIAYLARLHVEPKELPALTGRFNAILELFAQLQAAPTEGVEPMANPLDATQALREDRVDETNQREALQAVAPLVEDGLYLVPRVVE